ncbi:MAG: glycosyltransferase family 25 protein [Pseudomonadota bacterium]
MSKLDEIKQNFLDGKKIISPKHISSSDRQLAADLFQNLEEVSIVEDNALRRKMVHFLLQVIYYSEGYDGYQNAFLLITQKISEADWISAHLDILTADARFDDLLKLTKERAERAPNNHWIWRRHLHSLLAAAEVAEAITFAEDRIKKIYFENPKSLIHNSLRTAIRLLVSVKSFNTIVKQYSKASEEIAHHLGGTIPEPTMVEQDESVFQIYVLNLDRDAHRFRRFKGLLNGKHLVNRVPGVPGASVPRALTNAAGLKIDVPRPAMIGCHLSHLHAWEKISMSCEPGEYALVMEDDAQFVFGPGAGLDRAANIARTNGLDLMFINENAVKAAQNLNARDVYSPDEVFFNLDRGAKAPKTWGGEAYMVSAEGAKKLIQFELKLGIVAPLDYQLALCGIKDLNNVDPDCVYGNLAKQISNSSNLPKIHSAIYSMPLALAMPYGFISHLMEQISFKQSVVTHNE